VLPTAIKDGDMPNWKKVIVSGSNVSQLNNDGVYLRTIGDGVITSSAQLTSTFDTRYLNTTGDGVISSSAQIATNISGAFTAPSGGFSTRITSLETAGGTTFSSSIAGRVTNVETDLNTLESKTLVSSSAQIQAYDIFLEKLDDNVISSSQQIKDYNVFATTGSNIFVGDQTITGSLAINDVATNFIIEGNGFGETYLQSSTGNIVLYPQGGDEQNVIIKEANLNVEGSIFIQTTPTTGTSGDFLIYNSATKEVETRIGGVISSSAQVDHDSTTNFVANEHIDHTTVSISAGSGLSGGGTIAATRTLSLNTSSAHFTDGVKKKLNTDGVISSSAQLTSTFDTRYLNTTGDGVISSSAQISSQISGAFTTVSGGLAGRITSLEAAGGTAFSSSVSTRLTSVEGYTLDNVTDNGSSTTNGITIGGLTVNGNATITGTLTAQQFNTELISSSIIFESGSTKFGDSVDDVHSFTGSVKLNTQTAATTDTDKFLVFDTGGQIKYRTGAQVLSDINPGGLVSSSAQLTSTFDTRYLNTTGDGVISSSAQVTISSTTGYTTFSSSIAADIAALENAGYATVGTFASGAANESQRFALWQDTSGTVGGHPNFEYDTANGIIRMPDRSIRAHAVLWTTGTVSFAIASPVSSYGAAISYTFFRADAGRSAFKAGNITTAYNNAGTSVVFNETTTADFGVLTPLTVNVVVIGGVMHVQFTQTSGNSHGVSCNIDVMGI
jgi:hypothetical protein